MWGAPRRRTGEESVLPPADASCVLVILDPGNKQECRCKGRSCSRGKTTAESSPHDLKLHPLCTFYHCTLPLLYLMVRINSHTISKSIDNDEKVDDIFDSINDLDHTRNPKLRRDRYLHKYRSDYKDEFVRAADAAKETKLFQDTVKTTEKTSLKTTSEHTKHHKSPKRRVGSFWRKFRGKDKKKNKHNDAKERERRIPKNKGFAWKYPATKDTRNSEPRNKSRRKNRNQFVLRQPEVSFAKRAVSHVAERILFTTSDFSANNRKPPNKMRIGITPQLDNILKPYTQKVTEMREKPSENYDRLLASMTTQLTHLKEMYGLDKFSPPTYTLTPIFDKPIETMVTTRPTSTTTTAARVIEYEFPGTAQIEELLNDIKVKAIQMVAEQNPAVTDIITNTVTEATFEADPIVTHIDIASPVYHLSTLVSITDIGNAYGKRTVEPSTIALNLNDSVVITSTEPHYLVARSIKEDTMTMARNVEDMLQRELKNVYHKVKNKLSSDFCKEVHKAKSTIKEGLSKLTSKITSKASEITTKPCRPICTNITKSTSKTKITTAPRHSRGEHSKHETTEEVTSPAPTYDDYMMLTLYEQMLAKTHEENVMKMLSTADATVKKRRDHFKLSKRNAETLADAKLKENVQKIYDDENNMPDYDYVEPMTVLHTTETPDIVDDNEELASVEGAGKRNDSADVNSRENSQEAAVTHSSVADTSYEGLSNKICYNDFVNGYRHYLKFQKEQGSQNFSNLVKYQAHRHHSVDDIGKYILEKIPPLQSNNRKKRFFDDSDIDDQEISTKSDDSWFKKHFYLFIDNGPPKKYHTSQTVSLKSAVTDSEGKFFSTEDSPFRHAHRDQVFIKIGTDDPETTPFSKETAEMSLEDLSRILNSIKDKQSTHPYYRSGLSKPPHEHDTTLHKYFNSTDNVNLKIITQSFIGKLFGGKRRRAPLKQRETTEYDPELGIEIFTDGFEKRLRRTVTKEDMDNTAIDDVVNKDIEEKPSTTAKELDTDNVARVSKETNKYGYVDIDLIPRQTAIVKLRANTSKKSRFKDFFRKIHFKKAKNKKKSKRQCMYYTRRRLRFNPIKKLKDIFKLRNDERLVSPNYHVPNMMQDYEMITSHIDSFKPIKYDKILTIDEMRKQIPNISEVMTDDAEISSSTRAPAYLFKLDEKDHNLLYGYQITSTTTTMRSLPDQLLNFKNLNSEPISTSLKPSSMQSISEPQKIPPTNVITVNVKTIKPMQSSPTLARSETTPIMTLNDMHLVLNKLQYKLAKTALPFPKISTPYHKRGTMKLAHTRNKQPSQCRRPLEELTIKSKLTRIAKFPISKRHYKIRAEDIPHGNDYMSFQDGPAIKEYKHDMKNRITFPDKKKLSKLANNMKKNNNNNDNNNNANTVSSIPSENCKYTDYFNDLLMWHNDILNLDKVPSPIWKSILENIQSETGESYTTPSMNNLMIELKEMNEFLDESPVLNNVQSTPKVVVNSSVTELTNDTRRDGGFTVVRSLSNKHKRVEKNPKEIKQLGMIRSVAMDDKAVMTSKEFLIQGEAKYFQYRNPTIVDGRDVFSSGFNTLIGYDKRSKVMEPEKEKGVRSYSTSNTNEPAILVDTTLFAYDDDADSVTNGVEVKKLSRNSQKSTKVPINHLHSPHLKTNKPPMQYYTTPLPMKSIEFDKFLKDHKMDVESVTSPMVELPSFMEHWAPKTTKAETSKAYDIRPIEDTVEKTKKIQLTTQKLMKMTSRTALRMKTTHTERRTMKLAVKRPQQLGHVPARHHKKIVDDFDRYKRYSELNKIYPRNYVTIKPFKTTEANYYNMIKRKMKIFDKKATDEPTKPGDVFTLDPRNKEVEITIINFDDIDKLPSTLKTYEAYSIPDAKKDDSVTYDELAVVSELVTENSPKPAEYYQQKELPDMMHNELLYKDVFKERTTSTTTEFSSMEFEKNTDNLDHTTDRSAPFSKNNLRYPFEFLSKIPNVRGMELPKRVHISSHHYKYDIFYNDDKKVLKHDEGYRPKLSAETPTVPAVMIPRVIFTSERVPTSEDGTAYLHHNKLKKRKSYRRARDASTAAVTEAVAEAPPGSLVYDLKHLKRTTLNPNKERHRRLFKISALLQGKIKNLLKNSSSPVSSTAAPKRELKADNKRKCNCTCKDSNGTTTESEEDREDLKDEGFKVTCEPDEHKTTTLVTTTQTTTTTTTTEEQIIHHHHHHHHHHHTTENDDTEAPVTESTTRQPCFKFKGHVMQDLPNDTLYIEPDIYGDQAYYEAGPMHPPPGCPEEALKTANKHNDKKRDVQTAITNTFTAKDVAALEVIVDLMKNTLSYEEKDIGSVFNNLVQAHATKSVQPNETTNSIQVHIAIPFDFQNGKKRSPLDPVRVRKVFSAKMSTPVDLEYQVHSFEGTVRTTIAGHSTSYDDGLSPGMYLLVDKPKNGYALKPVKAQIDLSDLRTRQIGTPVPMIEPKPTEAREETTSLKSLARVTLSKDFIAAVNKQLIDLYENMTAQSKDRNLRKARSVLMPHNNEEKVETVSKKCSDKFIDKRHIDWEAVKKYFGHDRVCNCKCKANKAMCRACAASDAVIDELIFEFDNLGKYMKDHCTEIQTFFWMNPSGGQKLRDSVNRIDKSLGDYYKRVKGKCQGRTCKTFKTYIDKRQIVKAAQVPKGNSMSRLVKDLSDMAEDLNKTVSLKACFNKKLKEGGEKFLHAINNCILKKSFEKRSNPSTKRKLIKNVYSLDNINVNIICNPELSSSTDNFDATTVQVTHLESTQRVTDHLFDFEIEENRQKKRKGFKKLFPRKKKERLFTYYISENPKKQKSQFKRGIDSRVSPLISDGGGAFWYDYLRGSTDEPRVVRESSRDNPTFGVAVIQKGVPTSTPKMQTVNLKKTPTVNTIFMTVKTSPKRHIQDKDNVEGTTDYLSHNIHQLLQLFGSLQDIEAMNMNSNRSTMFLGHHTTPSYNKTRKKCTKYIKKIKTKIHYKSQPVANATDDDPINISTTPMWPKAEPKLNPKLEPKIDPANEPKFEPKIEPANEPKFEPKIEPANEPKSEPKLEPIVDSNGDAKIEPAKDSKLEPTNEPKIEPHNDPKLDTASEPKIESHNDPKLEPVNEPKVEPASEPKLESANEPNNESQSEPKIEPGNEPKLEPKLGSNNNEPKLEPKLGSNNNEPKLYPNVTDQPVHPAESTKITEVTSPKSPTTVTYETSERPSTIADRTEEEGAKARTDSYKKDDTETTENKKFEALTSEASKLPSATSKKYTSDLLETTPFEHPYTTTNFLGKLKTATLKFFDNVSKTYVYDDAETTIPEPTKSLERVTSDNLINRISETEMNLLIYKESSQMTTHMSPTIVIINEYEDQISSDTLNDSSKNSEGYKNLLLSIIQYETNRLNDEWNKIAYGNENGNEKDEGDFKRSIIELKGETTKLVTTQTTCKTKAKALDEYDVLEGLKLPDLELPEPKETKKPCGLLNKIASKIGMKVVPGPKKKAVKKANREETKKVKKKHRKRKQRGKNSKLTTRSPEEACDTRGTSKSSQTCDIQATYEHILDLHKTLPPKNFERLVKNITCYKYKRIERSFFIPYKSQGRRWDWIRSKRSLKFHFTRFEDDNEFDEESGLLGETEHDFYEKYVKGDDGIYKIIKRSKRTAGFKPLSLGLMNIPPLMPAKNELLVMVGDSITLNCLIPGTTPISTNKRITWTADRKNMLQHDNVEVNGLLITIRNVGPKNYGSYTCSQDNFVWRNVKLNVMTIPAFDVVFLPIYKTQRECTYDDLKAMQRLGVHMAEEAGCGNACSIRIDEPVCQKDMATNASLLRSTAVISMNTRRVNCSVQCRRDLVSSLVLLCAANTPVLSSVGVVISRDGINKTMWPCDKPVRPVVTHSLRKKDSNGHHEYHKLVSTLSPGKVDVVLICPAGYYLIQEHKICGSCPPNTSAAVGDNSCHACPRGTRSPPGAARCSLVGTEPRRYDWWWYPPCGYLVACGGLACGCSLCVALAMLVHVTSRDGAADDASYDGKWRKPKKTIGLSGAFMHTPRTRPLSPSRVILARFFKPSLTSSRATDSQETKFELWKERNIPPPLPPIDFDI